MPFSSNKAVQKDDSTILLISSIAVTFVFFLINEGNFSFDWMSNMSHWITFIMYAVFIFIGEVFVSNIVLKRYHSIIFTILSVIAGSALGILFVLEVVLRHW